MAKTPPNSGKPWIAKDIAELKKLAKGNTPTRVIAFKIGRSEEAVRKKARQAKISLTPINRPPYNRRKK